MWLVKKVESVTTDYSIKVFLLPITVVECEMATFLASPLHLRCLE